MSEVRMQRSPRQRLAVLTLVAAVASCGPESSPESGATPSWTVVEGGGEGGGEAGSGVGAEVAEPDAAPLAQDAVPLGRFVYAYPSGETSASLGYRLGAGSWERLVREQVTASGTWTLESSVADTRVLWLSQASGPGTRLVLVGVTVDSFGLEGAESLVYVRVEEPPAAVAEASGAEASGAEASGAEASGAIAGVAEGALVAIEGSALPASAASSVPLGTGASIRLNLPPAPAAATSP